MFLQQQAIIDKRTRPKFVQGRVDYYNADGKTMVADSKFVTSEPILGGQHYYLRVKEGYKISRVVFFDSASDKRIQSHTFSPNGSDLSGDTSGGTTVYIRESLAHRTKSEKMWTWIPTGGYVRVIVCKDDVLQTTIDDQVVYTGSDITPDDDMVDAFYLFDHVFSQPSTDRPSQARPNYHIGKMLARQVGAVYAQSRLATQDGSYTGAEGSVCTGVPYSAVSGQRPGSMNMAKPSMETYLSLWHNRRSLMYTEKPKASTGSPSVSEYGIVWDETDSRVHQFGKFAYGMVCNCAAATVFGMPEDVDENIWGTIDTSSNPNKLFTKVNYNSLEALKNDNASLLRSFDVMYTSGNHVLVITDVYNMGGERFIEVFESDANCRLRLFTPQTFYNYYMTKHSGAFTIVRPKKAFYDQVGVYDFRPVAGAPTTPRERTRYIPNDDICTFAGDKATFASGDPVWLNVRQTNGATGATFDSIRLYRKDGESYELVQTITMSTPASGHRKTFTDDGTNDVVWDIEVTSLFADGTLSGLFEATAYNSSTHAESAPTRFEVLNIGLSNACRVGLSANGSINYDLLATIDGNALAVGAERDVFIRALDSHYMRYCNNFHTYAHHHVHDHEEGKYGVMLANVQASLGTGDYCQLAVKGEYGYAFARLQLTSKTSLISSATINDGKYLSITDGNMYTANGSSTDRNWRVYVKAVGSDQRGKTFRIVYDDRLTHTGYHMVVSQYNAADASGIGSATRIKSQVIHRLGAPATGETRFVDVVIDAACTYIAVSTAKDSMGNSIIRDMVEMDVPVQTADEGYDYYFGWVDIPTEKLMLADMTAASLLTYATGYHSGETTQVRKTVTAEDVARYSNQIPFILYRDNHQPNSGSLLSGGAVTQWDRNSFEGTSASGNNWDTLGGKQVSIGGVTYRVASLWGNYNANDIIEIHFD